MKLPHHKKEHIKIRKSAKFHEDWSVRNWMASYEKSENQETSRHIPHSILKSVILAISKSLAFGSWPTNLAETWQTYKFWCALSCDEAISFTLIKFD